MIETKNDKAWEKLFHEHNILEVVDNEGFCQIKSETINKVREARLMAKFDHYTNLPRIFKENGLAILPTSRYGYIIGKFNAYAKVKYDDLEKKVVGFPPFIETIRYDDLYSESSALHCAFISKIIEDLVGEEVFFTVSGRMSSNRFGFQINGNNGSSYELAIDNSQTEIDGGFESQNSFMIIEAKNYSVEDFLIRQLYYPYRLWREKIDKKILPTFMTFSNDVFSFFVYQFDNPNIYNSLTLINQKHYKIAPELIQLTDIHDVFQRVKKIEEPSIPFPQADKFERVVDLLGLLYNGDLSKNHITENYQFDIRQTDYYTNAAIYLGLIEKYHSEETGDIFYKLSDTGRSIMKSQFKNKYLSLTRCILEHEVFYKSLEVYFQEGNTPNKETICNIMRNSYLYNIQSDSRNTIERRSHTVIGWINWILNLAQS